MESLAIIPTLRVNKSVCIGTVAFVVEGTKDEHNLIVTIFCNVYDYRVVKRERKPLKLTILESEQTNSRVIIVNTENSNIKSIDKFDGYRDRIYGALLEKYGISLANSPIFYIWDRDRLNNPARIVKNLIEKMYSPLDNGYYENGALLLSYPCLESYIVTCYEDKNNFEGKSPKKYLKEWHHNMSRIHNGEIIVAAATMLKRIKELGISQYNLDDFHDINDAINTYEENYYSSKKQYRIISLLSMALLYLDLIK